MQNNDDILKDYVKKLDSPIANKIKIEKNNNLKNENVSEDIIITREEIDKITNNQICKKCNSKDISFDKIIYDEKFEEDVLKFKCNKCGNAFVVLNPNTSLIF